MLAHQSIGSVIDHSGKQSHKETQADQAYQWIGVRALNGAMGAEIDAGSLAKPLAPPVIAEIRAAWLAYRLVVFRDQDLDTAQYAAFCEQFGVLDSYPFAKPTADHPQVYPIIKEPHQAFNFGGGWHTDTSYLEQPPAATCLMALEVPGHGGDTLFANTTAAFGGLSEGMQALTQKLTGVFTPALVHGDNGAFAHLRQGSQGSAETTTVEVAQQRVRHPIIRTHPTSGQKAIYAATGHCERFAGMTKQESQPLLQFLQEHATRPEFTARLQWQVGTVALWDNRCVFHYALNDYPGERREMRRVTLQGETPS